MRTELVTTLKRQATELLDDLARDKKPILITQHGVPTAVLMDVATWELQQSKMAILEGIARGERELAEGRTFTHAQVKAYFEKKWRK
jgi:prevent-host-death family protein